MQAICPVIVLARGTGAGEPCRLVCGLMAVYVTEKLLPERDRPRVATAAPASTMPPLRASSGHAGGVSVARQIIDGTAVS